MSRKLMIGMPSRGFIPARVIQGLNELVLPYSKMFIDTSDDIAISRDAIAVEAIKKNYQYVLWVDDDIVSTSSFDLSNLFRSAADSNASMITGVYYLKSKNTRAVIYDDVETYEHGSYISHSLIKDTKPFKIEACGMGFCLTKVSLLEHVLKEHGTMFSLLPHLGEDLSFCKRVRDLNYKIWCDPTVQLGHLDIKTGKVYTQYDYMLT